MFLSFVHRRGGEYVVMDGVVKTGLTLVPASGMISAFSERPYGIMLPGGSIIWRNSLGDAKIHAMDMLVSKVA